MLSIDWLMMHLRVKLVLVSESMRLSIPFTCLLKSRLYCSQVNVIYVKADRDGSRWGLTITWMLCFSLWSGCVIGFVVFWTLKLFGHDHRLFIFVNGSPCMKPLYGRDDSSAHDLLIRWSLIEVRHLLGECCALIGGGWTTEVGHRQFMGFQFEIRGAVMIVEHGRFLLLSQNFIVAHISIFVKEGIFGHNIFTI